MELILTILCFTVPFAIVGLWWWVKFWIGVIIYTIVFEIYVWKKTGKTLSQRFWDWAEQHNIKGWYVLLTLTLGWLALMYHLAKGML